MRNLTGGKVPYSLLQRRGTVQANRHWLFFLVFCILCWDQLGERYHWWLYTCFILSLLLFCIWFLHSFLKFTSIFIYFICFVCMTQFWHYYFCTNSFWNPVMQCPKLKVGLKFWSARRCFPSQLHQHSRGSFPLRFASWNPGHKQIIISRVWI